MTHMLQINAPYTHSLYVPPKTKCFVTIDILNAAPIIDVVQRCGSDIILYQDSLRGRVAPYSCLELLMDTIEDTSKFSCFITVIKNDLIYELFQLVCDTFSHFHLIEAPHIIGVQFASMCGVAYEQPIDAISLINEDGMYTLEDIMSCITECLDTYKIDNYSLNNYFGDMLGYIISPTNKFSRWSQITTPVDFPAGFLTDFDE